MSIPTTSRPTIRPAFSNWPAHNQSLLDVVAQLTEEQLALRPAVERWPIWATIGHLACQRVFWLCDFAREPGADATPFRNAAYNCPGDDDLDHVLNAEQLVAALDSTFGIVENCLNWWTLDSLEEVIDHPEWDGEWARTRGSVIQRVFAHDIYHVAELNEVLGVAGLPQVDLWD
ncbi:MAG: DinB family protein [Candidatus Limnocylindrales bacterium]